MWRRMWKILQIFLRTKQVLTRMTTSCWVAHGQTNHHHHSSSVASRQVAWHARTNKIKGQKGEEGGVGLGGVCVIGARISMQRRRRSTHACMLLHHDLPGPWVPWPGTVCMARSTGTCVCAFDHSGSSPIKLDHHQKLVRKLRPCLVLYISRHIESLDACM